MKKTVVKVNLNAKIRNESLVADAISEWYRGHSYGPSFRDLAKMTGLSVGGLYQICKQMRDDGKVHFETAVARSIKLKDN
jgi:hypothetical protein